MEYIAPRVRVGTLVPDLVVRNIISHHNKEIKSDAKGKEEVVFHHDEGYHIIFKIKKVICSPQHREIFEQSLEWPEDGGTIKLQKFAEADEKQSSFMDLAKALSNGIIDKIRYQCSICREFHNLALAAVTTVLEM